MSHRTTRNWERARRHFGERNLEAARASCEAVLSQDPDHAQAHWMLSCLSMGSGRFRDAAARALKAKAELKDEPMPVALNVSWALISAGETEAAMDVLEKLPAPPAEFNRLYVDAAVQYALVDRHAESLRCAEKALAAGFDHAATHQVHGQALQYLGRIEEAVAAFERALSRQPDLPSAHWFLSQSAPANGAEQRIDRLRRLLRLARPESEEQAGLNYALFRELDRQNDTEPAWRALEAGAAARHRIVRHDRAAERALFETIVHSTRVGSMPRSAAMQDVTPVFIVGMPRTGTTLLERILGNHPDVAVCGELNDLRMQYKWVTDRACPGYLDLPSAAMMSAIDAPLLGERYLEKTRWRRESAKFQVDKNQTNFLYCGPIANAVPGAKIIHMRRDPMDSCFSNLKELFDPQAYSYSYSFEDLAAHFQAYRALMDHWQEIAPGAILDVDYESLASDPEVTAKRVMAFCGLEYEPGQAQIESNSAPVSTASSVQVRQPIHRRGIGAWRRYERHLQPLLRLLENA